MPFEHPTSAPSADVSLLEPSPTTGVPGAAVAETDAPAPDAAAADVVETAAETEAADDALSADAATAHDAGSPADAAAEHDEPLPADEGLLAARSGDEQGAARRAALTAVRTGAAATRSAAVAAAAGGRRRVAAAGASLAAHTPHRLALPVVLVTATATGLAGLSGGTAATTTAQVRAAAASAPLAVEPFAKPLDLLDGPATATPTPTAAPVTKKAAPPRAKKASRARRAAPAAPRYVRPVSAGISSYFGRRWGRMHEGLDFSAGYGAPIRAVTSGRVISAGYDGGYGNMVLIQHSDGVVTAYAHMSRILVRGGSVDAGEVIGRVGSTGNSTGAHLHFEVRVGGSAINPLKWLRKKGVRL